MQSSTRTVVGERSGGWERLAQGCRTDTKLFSKDCRTPDPQAFPGLIIRGCLLQIDALITSRGKVRETEEGAGDCSQLINDQRPFSKNNIRVSYCSLCTSLSEQAVSNILFGC